MDIGKEKNKMILELICFHLDEAMGLCSQLDLSGLSPLEKGEWDKRMKTCKDAIEFTMASAQKLGKTLSPR